MPLSPPVDREPIHFRRYEFAGYRRGDGFWEIEGRMVDTKSYAFQNSYRGTIQPGEPLHDMLIRLTIDEDFVVRGVEAVTKSGPFGICPAITASFKKLVGAKIARGWRKTVLGLFGGTAGCTHHTEMLIALATVAFQTLYPLRESKGRNVGSDRKPVLIDSCHAFASDGPLVKQNWAAHYTGE